MIQRIQTVWLSLSALLLGVFTLSDLSVLTSSGGQGSAILSAWSVRGLQGESLGSLWWIGGLAILIAVLTLTNLLLYKRRMLQLRLGNFIALLLGGLILSLVYLHWTLTASLDASIGVKIPLAFPLVCLILQALAIRGILADEMLVRMSRRLR